MADLKSKLVSKREREALLHQVKEYYHSERLYILRCLKYLIGYWQDPSHPYRVSVFVGSRVRDGWRERESYGQAMGRRVRTERGIEGEGRMEGEGGRDRGGGIEGEGGGLLGTS